MKLSESVASSQSFLDLQSIIMDQSSGKTKICPKLSFWGGRYIQVLGYNGTADIDELAAKVIKLVYQKNFTFTDEERVIGNRIAGLISDAYHQSDAQVANANFLTRLFCFLRECTYGLFEHDPNPINSQRTCSKTRWVWLNPDSGGMCRVFSYYTSEQYEEKFQNNGENYLVTNPFRLYAENPYMLPRLAYRQR